jgi:hypothetical protein
MEEAVMGTTFRRVLLGVASAATVAALTVPGAAFAKGPGGAGAGGGGGGGGEEPLGKSLAVPAVFVGQNPYALTCDPQGVAPTGEPSTGFSVPGSFYVQGVHTWRAGCVNGADSATAVADWGDNLTGSASLRVGSPIRVEMGLLAESADDAPLPDMTGWEVQKLEPAQLDRVSPYGILATATDTGFEAPGTTPYPETRVWTAGATLKIFPRDNPAAPVYAGPASAEINSTGRVVFGYNLRVKAAGEYVIEYTFPDVALTGISAVENPDVEMEIIEPSTVWLVIDVGASAGGGGGGGGGGGPRR